MDRASTKEFWQPKTIFHSNTSASPSQLWPGVQSKLWHLQFRNLCSSMSRRSSYSFL